MNNGRSLSRRGQALIQVAVTAVLLILMLALSIEVGHIYSERRLMQNAADSGALAGAREICFGDSSQASSTALEYAEANGADAGSTTISIEDNVVDVIAGKSVGLFFGAFIGRDTMDVAANAAAACGDTRNACNLWPLAFSTRRWDELDCGANPGEGETFYVFNDARFERKEADCEHYDCDIDDPPDGTNDTIGPGQRGWLLFPPPEPPYDDDAPRDCGANQLKWYLENNYSGSLEPGPEGICIAGKSGNLGSGVLDQIINGPDGRAGELVRIPLWDNECTATGDCSGASDKDYHVVDFACIEIVESTTINLFVKPEYENNIDPETGEKYQDFRNIKVIKARKACGECPNTCGAAAGETPDEVNGVSLIR